MQCFPILQTYVSGQAFSNKFTFENFYIWKVYSRDIVLHQNINMGSGWTRYPP